MQNTLVDQERHRKEEFKRFLLADSTSSSNKASSYLRAIDLISEMIKRQPAGFANLQNLWALQSTGELVLLYQFLLREARNDQSFWIFDDLPVSYLRDGFCSAAIKHYHQYLTELNFEQKLVSAYTDNNELSAAELADIEASHLTPECFIDDLPKLEGKERVGLQKQRTNQSVFRNLVAKNYQGRCCITGLNIAAVNRASHIIGWAKDKTKRLDPRNGLYLSATYDAAFDRHLISLDDDLRVILSRDLKEFHSQDSFQRYFRSVEGQTIAKPYQFSPRIDYLAAHRSEGNF